MQVPALRTDENHLSRIDLRRGGDVGSARASVCISPQPDWSQVVNAGTSTLCENSAACSGRCDSTSRRAAGGQFAAVVQGGDGPFVQARETCGPCGGCLP